MWRTEEVVRLPLLRLSAALGVALSPCPMALGLQAWAWLCAACYVDAGAWTPVHMAVSQVLLATECSFKCALFQVVTIVRGQSGMEMVCGTDRHFVPGRPGEDCLKVDYCVN